MLTNYQQLPQLAVKALLYEVSVTPKPGLVDPASQGPHPDMDVFTFIDSAMSLMPYFEQCTRVGADFEAPNLTTLFRQIRPIGVQAEKTMLVATNGVNTHKGAIFSLGILVTASAYLIATRGKLETATLFQTVRVMLTGLVARDLGSLKATANNTAGERQYLTYGQGGIRVEAEAGYPTVEQLALPALRQAQGTRNQRLLDTLILIAGHTADSNLIKRAGSTAILSWMQDQSQRYADFGGSRTATGWQFLEALNQIFLERNLSLGGSADLLILTIFVGLIEGII